MTENKFKNATKIDNANLVRNTMAADPSQNGTPVPFQSGYSEYEAKKQSQSSSEIILFYTLGLLFSVLAYCWLINSSVLNEEWQNEGIKVAIVIFSIVAISFVFSKILIMLGINVKRRFLNRYSHKKRM
ncbi:hypothetical protein DOK67_0001019 [Enterococcus sp. DIV0212c]|uniref:hypothetical protein n=1 Tax=Enterococcus sp. DIV0212c TaxID=2230867 RepID=UPI001A9B61FF|nr:hypothetical protein [Enterococcus sp. DIV0212c]MBO1352719.1 hypothetical protein [Enterococcus sp. DIV0212c]